jgi:hypothetical protein
MMDFNSKRNEELQNVQSQAIHLEPLNRDALDEECPVR